MANQEHLDLLRQGVKAWNQWRETEPDMDVDLRSAHLDGARLAEIHLEKADLTGIQLKNANLAEAHLEGAWLLGAHLENANLAEAHLEGVGLVDAHLEKANLASAHLEGANLGGAHLEGAWLSSVHLENAYLDGVHLEGAFLEKAHLQGSVLWNAFLDRSTSFEGIILADKHFGAVSLADVRWGDVNVAVVDWSSMKKVGDEIAAQRPIQHDGKTRRGETQVDVYRRAVRANRQLTGILRDQGLNEEADYFAYRAHLLQRVVWRKQRRLVKYLFSWFLYLIAGYGYRPLLSITAYLLLILGFAGIFSVLGHLVWYEALVVSLTAFHGRGFFSQQYQPGDPQSIIAAIEAVVGLLIEISFIATFTQRFFGR